MGRSSTECRASVRLLKVSNEGVDFYDYDEYGAMVAAAEAVGPQAHLIVLLGGDAGLRAGEMRALEWSDINFGKGQICVERNDWRGQVTSTKGGRLRHVRVPDRLLAALQAHGHLRGPRVLCQEDGRPLAEHMLTDILKRVAGRANMNVPGRSHPAAHVLFAPGDARTRRCERFRSSRDIVILHDAAVHALEPECDGSCGRTPRTPSSSLANVATVWRRREPDEVVGCEVVSGEPGRNRTFNQQIKSLPIRSRRRCGRSAFSWDRTTELPLAGVHGVPSNNPGPWGHGGVKLRSAADAFRGLSPTRVMARVNGIQVFSHSWRMLARPIDLCPVSAQFFSLMAAATSDVKVGGSNCQPGFMYR